MMLKQPLKILAKIDDSFPVIRTKIQLHREDDGPVDILNQRTGLILIQVSQKIFDCLRVLFSISQSALSKMFAGTSIQPLQVAQVCAVLGLNIAEILSLDKGAEIHLMIL